MKPFQFGVRYLNLEDRILWLIGTQQAEEYRMLFTRSIIKRFMPTLVKLLDPEKTITKEEKAKKKPEDIERQRAMMGFEHEKVVAESDFEQKFIEDPTSFPLGEEPLLVVSIALTPKEDDFVFIFKFSNNQNLSLTLPRQAVHGIYKLLTDAVRDAEWDIYVDIPSDQYYPEDKGKLM